MGIYENTSIVFGARILTHNTEDQAYYVKYQFLGKDWQKNAIPILKEFINNNDVIIQLLHPATTTFNPADINLLEAIWLNTTTNKIQEIINSLEKSQ
jgi:hypothetical protein